VHAAPEGVLRLADRDALALPARREPLVLRLRLALADLHAGLGDGAAAARLALIERLLAERLALGGVGAGIQAALRGVLRPRLAVGRARSGGGGAQRLALQALSTAGARLAQRSSLPPFR